MPLLLLSKPNPLRWASVWVGGNLEAVWFVEAVLIAASTISLAAIFYTSYEKSPCAHSAAAPFQITTTLLGCDLVWVLPFSAAFLSIWLELAASFISLAPTFFILFQKVRARSCRCSSFPNRTRFAGLRFGLAGTWERFGLLRMFWLPQAQSACGIFMLGGRESAQYGELEQMFCL